MSTRDPNQFIDQEADKDSETHSHNANSDSDNDSNVPDEFEEDDFITYDEEDDEKAKSQSDSDDSASLKRKRHPRPVWMDEEEPDKKRRKTGYRRLKKKKSALRDEEEEEVVDTRPRESRDDEDMSSFIVGQSRDDIVEQGGDSIANIFGESHPMEVVDTNDYMDEGEMYTEEEGFDEDQYSKLKQLYSEEELKSKYMTDRDEEIKEKDIPERIQLRQSDREEVTADEINKEASWIISRIYSSRVPIDDPDSSAYKIFHNKVVYVLKQMHLHHCDIPYISQYLEENWSTDLSEDDLWLIYGWDEKWYKLQKKKSIIRKLYETCVNTVPDVYKDMLREATSMEELRDLSQHFQLHYQSDEVDIHATDAKKPMRRNMYLTAKKSDDLQQFAKKIALPAKDYAHNLKSGIMLHFVEDPELLPEELASTYTNRQFSSAALVLKLVRHIHAYEISKEPYVRSAVRECYQKYAEISTELSPKGKTAGIFRDRNTELKNLKRTALQSFKASPEKLIQFMEIMQAKRDELVKVTINVPNDHLDLVLDPTANYHSDKTNDVADNWNKERSKIIDEVKSLLKGEMTDFVLDQYMKSGMEVVGKECYKNLINILHTPPYSSRAVLEASQYSAPSHENIKIEQWFPPSEDAIELTDQSLTQYSVLSCAPGKNSDEPIVFTFLDRNGVLKEVITWKYPPYISPRARKNDNMSAGNAQSGRKKTDVQIEQEKKLTYCIGKYRPDVLAVGTSGLNCQTIFRVIDEIQERIPEDSRVRMEFVSDKVATIFENSTVANEEMKEMPRVVRRAISLGRFFNDPLSEMARLFNRDFDIALLKVHPLQDMLRKSQLSDWFEQAFIREVCAVGVDLNRIIFHKHLQSSLQFISGLGPRKADALIKTVLSTENTELHSRSYKRLDDGEIDQDDTQSLQSIVGENVFKNCAGFLKIVSQKKVEDEAAEFNPLDGTRVHPESYNLGEKICVDALDADYETEGEKYALIEKLTSMYNVDGNWVGKPGFEEQDKLESLDLERYAQNLEDFGVGKKYKTLENIKQELKCPFKDPRPTYKSMTYKEVFYSAISESEDTFNVNSIVFVTISDVSYGKLFGYLDNGVKGMVTKMDGGGALIQNYSVGQSLEAVVERIDYRKFLVELNAEESKIQQHTIEDVEAITRHANEKKKRKIVRRNIKHPFFKNFDFNQAKDYLSSKPPGECVIRPSSKGSNHLSLTYKWYGNSVVSIDIEEKKKKTLFTLGEELWAKGQTFEDLDDLHYNLVELVIENAERVVNHPKYKDCSKEEIIQSLQRDKQKNPKIIPYCFGTYEKYPGKFFVYYLPGKQTVLYEPVSVTSKGFKFFNIQFASPTKLINHFKGHYKELPSFKRKLQASSRRENAFSDDW